MIFDVNSGNLDSIQKLFGLSLTEKALEIPGKHHFSISPIFGKPLPVQKSIDVFVAMPFQPEMKSIHQKLIVKVCKELNLTCVRGDDSAAAQASIIDEIWSYISASRLCVIDMTGENANVFYELGIAHTLGKPCILITQCLDDVPFDVRHRRIIAYNTSVKGLEALENELSLAIQQEARHFAAGDDCRYAAR